MIQPADDKHKHINFYLYFLPQVRKTKSPHIMKINDVDNFRCSSTVIATDYSGLINQTQLDNKSFYAEKKVHSNAYSISHAQVKRNQV